MLASSHTQVRGHVLRFSSLVVHTVVSSANSKALCVFYDCSALHNHCQYPR